MKVELTQRQIDVIYFTLKVYIKNLYDVDYLSELTDEQAENWKEELEIIKKFSEL